MTKHKEIPSGTKYNNLTIIERVNNTRKGNTSVPAYRCLCFCGNESIVAARHLPNTKSCGCLKTQRENLAGRTFHGIVVVSLCEWKSKYNTWNCICSCGQQVVRSSRYLKSKKATCPHKNKTNPKRINNLGNKTPEYTVWDSMIQRCLNPNDSAYGCYGKRGILPSERWLLFENFLEDMGNRPANTTLDRIDNTKGYFKGNCRWVSNSVQGYNQRRRRTNTSGKTGVSWNKRNNKWESYITVKNKRIPLGLYAFIEDAIKVRKEAELRYFGFNKDDSI